MRSWEEACDLPSQVPNSETLLYQIDLGGTLGAGCSGCRCVASLHGAGLVLRVLRGWGLWRWTGLGHHQRLGPQGRGLELHPHAGCDRGLEGAHGVAGGAGAATHGRLAVGGGPQHDSVDGAEGVAGAGGGGATATSAPRALPLLQGVQHHVGSVLG